MTEDAKENLVLESHFFDCQCHSDEHVLRFVLDREHRELYTSIFLDPLHPWWKRLWLAARYVLGRKSSYGHWDCWLMLPDDARRLRALLDEYLGSAADEASPNGPR